MNSPVRRGRPVRRSLFQTCVALVLAVCGAMLVAASLQARAIARASAAAAIDRTSTDVAAHLDAYTGKAAAMARTLQAWVRAGLAPYREFDDLTRLNALYIPLLREDPHIASVAVGNSDGFEYLLLHDVSGTAEYAWYNRVVWVDRSGFEPYEAVWTDAGGLLGSRPLPADKREYDPRQRPRYLEAKPETPYWSAPGHIAAANDVATAVSLKWREPGDPERTWIVSVNLLLADISSLTARQRVSDRGVVFVLLDDGAIVGMPGGAEAPDANAETVTAVLRAWEAGERRSTARFRLSFDGDRWWAGFSPYPLEAQRLWVGIALPEADVLGGMARMRGIVVLIAIGALIGASVLALRQARAYGAPLDALATGARRVAALDFSSGPPVSSELREIQILADVHADMRATLEAFAQYVPVELVRELIERGEAARVGGRPAHVTMLCADVKDFAQAVDSVLADEVAQYVSEYFEALHQAIRDYQGTLAPLVGGATLAFWGAPGPDAAQTQHALEAVLDARRGIAALNTRWQAAGKPSLIVRFGLHAGEVVAGTIGTASQLHYTLLGSSVGLVRQLDALNALYGTTILASAGVRNACVEAFAWRRIDTIVAAGKAPLDIFELLGGDRDVSARERALVRQYETALDAYQAGRVEDALDVLTKWTGEAPTDRASQRLLQRCLAAREDRVQWSPVTQLDEV